MDTQTPWIKHPILNKSTPVNSVPLYPSSYQSYIDEDIRKAPAEKL